MADIPALWTSNGRRVFPISMAQWRRLKAQGLTEYPPKKDEPIREPTPDQEVEENR